MHRIHRPRLLVVFYANPDFYPPTYNAVSLLREHFDVRILCRKSDSETRLWPAGVRLDRVGPGYGQSEAAQASKFEKFRELSVFVWSVRRTLSKVKPSVVLAYEPHAFAALRLARCRAPIVYQRHEVEELEQFDLRTLGGHISRYALKESTKAALVVFPEAHRAAYYAKHAGLSREPLMVPNYPLLGSFPKPDFDNLLPARVQSPHVLYRGSVGRGNGLLEAVRTVPKLRQNLSLRVCGAGSPAFIDEMIDLAKQEGVTDRVELVGYVPFDELNRQTLKASVGLMLYQPISTNWTFIATANNKLYEYAACGVPAVAPDRLAFQELLADEDWVTLVDESDPRAIAGGVERLLSSPETYARRARSARRSFEERFNYQAVFGPMLARTRELAEHYDAQRR